MSRFTERFVKRNNVMGIKLSICIPVYNCAEFLGQALDSILPQTKELIEVIVYDGGSTDATPALLDTYVKAWPNLQYQRGAHRGGIDADMAKCASFAQGEYIWLFSGDDVMRPGSVKRALEWIDKGDDVYLCEHTICDREMVMLRAHPTMLPNQNTCVDFSNPTLRLEWFQRALTTEAFFSFISSLMVRREKWQSGRLIEEFNGSCWGHVARLFGLMASGLTVCYVAEVWLDQRGENDSFADKGIVNRYRIAIDGYHRLADHFFGHESIEAYHIRRVIRNEFTLSVFLHAKIQCMKNPTRENRQLLDTLFKMAYSDNSLEVTMTRYAYLIRPYWLLTAAKFAYQPIKKIRRMMRNV